MFFKVWLLVGIHHFLEPWIHLIFALWGQEGRGWAQGWLYELFSSFSFYFFFQSRLCYLNPIFVMRLKLIEFLLWYLVVIYQLNLAALKLCKMCDWKLLKNLIFLIVPVNVCLDCYEIFSWSWLFKPFLISFPLNLVFPRLEVGLVDIPHFVNLVLSDFAQVLAWESMDIFIPVQFFIVVVEIRLHRLEPVEICGLDA